MLTVTLDCWCTLIAVRGYLWDRPIHHLVILVSELVVCLAAEERSHLVVGLYFSRSCEKFEFVLIVSESFWINYEGHDFI